MLTYGFGAIGAAQVVLGMLAVAAFLESALGFCLGCKAFGLLMRAGVIPESVCEACNDIWACAAGHRRQLTPLAAGGLTPWRRGTRSRGRR